MWNDYARLIRECKPDWVIIENSPRLYSIPEWGGVQSDMEKAGYEIRCFRIPAAGVGAPHIRERAVIIANTLRFGLETGDGFARRSEKTFAPHSGLCCDSGGKPADSGDWGECQLPDWKTYPPCICRMDDGVPASLDKPRLQALGNAVVPRVFYPFFRAIRAIELGESK